MASRTATQLDWRQWEGQVVAGKYRLIQCLGASDHSGVFVTERDPGQKAAIKLLVAPWVNSPDAQLARWQVASTLSHPNLLRLYEFGKCNLGQNSFLYVITELADEDLSQILPQRALTADEAKPVLNVLVSVLRYVQQHGFVHGRIKPSNIMAVGETLKISSDSVGLPDSPALGWPDVYSAPEFGRGMTAAADMWSLGVTTMEVLTQKTPPQNKAADLPIPATLPQPFPEIVRHSVRRDPQQRWTVNDIANALRPAPVAPPSTEPLRARPRYLVPILAIAILIVALFVFAFTRRPSDSLQSAPSAPPQNTVARTEPAPESAPKPSPGTSSASSPALPVSTAGGGAVLHRVMPEPSHSAMRTVTGHVRVSIRANVDSSGKVTQATFATHGPSQYFARLAMNAAKQWTFQPPIVNGSPTASRWVLRFQFGRTSTTASASQQNR